MQEQPAPTSSLATDDDSHLRSSTGLYSINLWVTVGLLAVSVIASVLVASASYSYTGFLTCPFYGVVLFSIFWKSLKSFGASEKLNRLIGITFFSACSYVTAWLAGYFTVVLYAAGHKLLFFSFSSSFPLIGTTVWSLAYIFAGMAGASTLTVGLHVIFELEPKSRAHFVVILISAGILSLSVFLNDFINPKLESIPSDNLWFTDMPGDSWLTFATLFTVWQPGMAYVFSRCMMPDTYRGIWKFPYHHTWR